MTLHRPCPNGAPATKPTRKSTDRRTGDRRSTRIAHCTRRKSADRIAPASQTAIQVGMRQGSTQAFYRVTPKSPGNRRQRTDADRLQTMDHARAACMDASWRVRATYGARCGDHGDMRAPGGCYEVEEIDRASLRCSSALSRTLLMSRPLLLVAFRGVFELLRNSNRSRSRMGCPLERRG